MTFTGIIALLYSNKYLRQLRKLIESGRGTFSDTFRYTDKSADILSDLFYGSVLDMPDEERITSCVELLRDRHKDINGLFDIAQRSLDKKAGLSIAPQHVPFDEERAKQIGASLTDKTVPETTIQRRAKSATANATRSMHDDCIEANAKFRAKAGLQCYITRTTDGSCCKWCTQMAGRYEYGSEPKNVYRRHDNCGCMVTYENGRKRQNVWSKKTWEVPADDAGAPPPVVFAQKQAAAAGAPPPKSFTKEEAQELNSANVKKNSAKADSVHNSSIDNSVKSGIIKSENLKMSADTGFTLGEKQYEVKEDKKRVEDSYNYAKEVLGAGNVKFDKLKNNEVIQPMLEQINILKTKHKKSFSQIFVDDTMSDADFAMVSPDLSLHLNAKYMNSAEATADFLARMKEQKLLPKGFENTDYLITHEYMHYISRSEVDNPRAKVHKVIPDETKMLKNAPSKNSLLSKNEYVADSMAMIEVSSINDYSESKWNSWLKIYNFFFN